MTVAAPANRPTWGIGCSVSSVWIVLTSIALISGSNGRRYFVQLSRTRMTRRRWPAKVCLLRTPPPD